MLEALRRHWPEYLMEAALLAIFMMSACGFATLLEHPASRVHQALPNAIARRALMGLAMGLTAIALIYSPWGKQSGAHLNPSVTLTFLRLGKIKRADAMFYLGAQFAGGIFGVLSAALLLGGALAHPHLNYVVTAPGTPGPSIAFIAELAISFLLMSMVLFAASRPGLSPRTGLFAGAMVALYIAIEAPLSGMSMNPARSLGSALAASSFSSLWIYFVAPPLGMVLAAELHRRIDPCAGGHCAKLHHDNEKRCIHCGANGGG